MHPDRLLQLLNGVQTGDVSVDSAVEQLRCLPYEDLGFANVDHHRALRTGFPEVIFAAGKQPQQVVDIARCVVDRGQVVLVTRAGDATREALRVAFAEAPLEIDDASRTAIIGTPEIHPDAGNVLVISAGTSDLPVAAETVMTLRALGCPAGALHDVGVAGLHRLLLRRPQLDEADVIVVVAGMEGALPSVVAGLVRVPVIAVPTSVGYGASFGGLAALLGMLNSCASGVTVVNIDNGFGAGYAAALMAGIRARGGCGCAGGPDR